MPKGKSFLKQPNEESSLIPEPTDSDPVDIDELQADDSEDGKKVPSLDVSPSAAGRRSPGEQAVRKKRGRPKKMAAAAPAGSGGSESDDNDEDEPVRSDSAMDSGESENLGAKGEDVRNCGSIDSSKNGHAVDQKKPFSKDVGAAADECPVPRKRGRPRKSDRPSAQAAEPSAHGSRPVARKRGRPRKCPDQDSAGRSGGGSGSGSASAESKMSPKRAVRRRSFTPSTPSATVQVSTPRAERSSDTKGVYRIMLDISRNVFHDKAVQHVTIRPLNAGEGDALPQGSKVIHLVITDP